MKTFNIYYNSYEQLKEYTSRNEFRKSRLRARGVLVQMFVGILDKDYLFNVKSEILELLPEAQIVGASTCGEIMNGIVTSSKIVISFSFFEHTLINTYFLYPTNGCETDLIENFAKESLNEKSKGILLLSNTFEVDTEKILYAFETLYPDLPVFGGGAGDNLNYKDQFVFTNNEISNHGLAIAVFEGDEILITGEYCLSWQTIGKMFTITKADGNIIKEINNQPAALIYKKYLGEGLGNMYENAGLEFPLIFYRDGLEIAREVLDVNSDDSLSLTGHVEIGEKFQFSYGYIDKILNDSNDMVERVKLSSIETIFVYSSVARRGLFQDAVNVEIMPLQKIAPVSGFFTHGEFHHTKGQNKLFNQSMTVVMMSEQDSHLQVSHGNKKNSKTNGDFFKGRFFSIIKVLNHLITTVTQELKEAVEELNSSNQKMTSLIEELRLQKRIIESSNQRMLDSIGYAKKIQHAILPPTDLVDELLGEHFIFYQPKDIVSGDFYWVSEKSGKLICAVADCTGHGVPGAFMSMLGISLLNEITSSLSAKDATNPAMILQKLRDKVKRSLHQTNEIHGSKDGMDIALCVIDKAARTISYAGAFNPLYLVRDSQLIEFKADRSPIGVYLKEKNGFTNHVFNIQDKDMIYLSTDGYKDQMGGPVNRKLMVGNFKKLLIDISTLEIEKQAERLSQFLDQWKAGTSQIDDILVLGFRINLVNLEFEYSI